MLCQEILYIQERIWRLISEMDQAKGVNVGAKSNSVINYVKEDSVKEETLQVWLVSNQNH